MRRSNSLRKSTRNRRKNTKNRRKNTRNRRKSTRNRRKSTRNRRKNSRNRRKNIRKSRLHGGMEGDNPLAFRRDAGHRDLNRGNVPHELALRRDAGHRDLNLGIGELDNMREQADEPLVRVHAGRWRHRPLRIDLGFIKNEEPKIYNEVIKFFHERLGKLPRDDFDVYEEEIKNGVPNFIINLLDNIDLNTITDKINEYIKYKPSVTFDIVTPSTFYDEWLDYDETLNKDEPTLALKLKVY